MAKVVFITLIFINLCQAQQPLTLSEIMFNPSGDEDRDEFIEIFNLSHSLLDLSGWRISDGAATDRIVGAGEGTLIQPGQFAIILDPDYFGNSISYDTLIPPEALVLTIDNKTFGSGGLSNSKAETIYLINADGDTISSYTYSVGNKPGHSDEKIILSGPNTPDNWADSKTSGGTPGSRNSVTPRDFDLKLARIIFTPQRPSCGENITLSVLVENTGLEPAEDFRVGFFQDVDRDSIPEDAELFEEIEVEGLARGDSIEVVTSWIPAEPGGHRILAVVDYQLDQYPSDNRAFVEIFVSFPPNALVINEIMYSPLPGQAEWVELYNLGKYAVDLKDWRLSDSNASDRIIITQVSLVVQPSGYAVIASDSSIFDLYSITAPVLIPLEKMPVLNNDFDWVLLYDPNGTVIDSVAYSSRWGGDIGVSLERINPGLGSNDSTNWSSCVLSSGGTPGEENSIFTPVLPREASLSASPNPFSPDGDGREDFTVISYRLPLTTAAVNIKIYDIRGRLVRTLFNNEPSGSSRSVIWDGRDDDGKVLRMGVYIIYLEALNSYKGVIKTVKGTVVLAGRL